MNIINQLKEKLNEKLQDYPHAIYKFEVIDSPEGIIVTFTERISPSTPSQYENDIYYYQSIISVCAPVSAKMIATYSQGVLYERPQYVYVFAVQEK